MRTSSRSNLWLKLMACTAACGYLFQPAACTAPPDTLGQQLLGSIANQFIAGFFSDLFNVGAGSFF